MYKEKHIEPYRGMEIVKGDNIIITLKGSQRVAGQFVDYEGEREVSSEDLKNLYSGRKLVGHLNYYMVSQSLRDEAEGKFYLKVVNEDRDRYVDGDLYNKSRSEILSMKKSVGVVHEK